MWILELNNASEYLQVVLTIHNKLKEKLGDELKQERWMPAVPPLSAAGKPFVIIPDFLWKMENIREWILQHLPGGTPKQVELTDENYFPKPVGIDLNGEPNWWWEHLTHAQKIGIMDFLRPRRPELFL